MSSIQSFNENKKAGQVKRSYPSREIDASQSVASLLPLRICSRPPMAIHPSIHHHPSHAIPVEYLSRA